MVFPSRGCYTCKKRRVKCDEAHPICERCQKAKLVCHAVKEARALIFLNENEYAVGRRKRPRGPNVKRIPLPQGTPELATSNQTEIIAGPLNTALKLEIRPTNPQNIFLSQALAIPLDDQALAYYTHYYVEVPHGLPEIVDGHMKYSNIGVCYSQPESILSLAILALSHATYGRARHNYAALAVAGSRYSKVLMKTNAALKNADAVTSDDVLLAAMLLSFYENTVMNKMSQVSRRNLQATASRSFAHHDGAMAMLKLRRQLNHRRESSTNLDKLVRRQLIRSLILRSLPAPSWIRDGSQYGETELALKLDRCMIIVAKLRHQADSISAQSARESHGLAALHSLLGEARALDDALLAWAGELSIDGLYSICNVQENGVLEKDNRIFGATVHIYPNVGYAGTWNRYRALRLIVNDVVLKILSLLVELDAESQLKATQLNIQQLASDLCASVPYMLGVMDTRQSDEQNIAIVTKTPASLKVSVRAATASLLCWPLTIATIVSGIPEAYQCYLRDRLLDVSEIVDDGVLEKIATSCFHSSSCLGHKHEVSS